MNPENGNISKDQAEVLARLRAKEAGAEPPAEPQPGVPTAWVSVEKREGVIHARYAGKMTLEMVEKAAKRIRELLTEDRSARILYDTRQMEEPGRELTRRMLEFDEEIRPRVAKAATLAPNMMVEAQARAAFVNSPEHQFFHELVAALDWLRS